MTFNERCPDGETSEQGVVETPFRRYVKKTKLNIEKKKKLYELKMKEQETQRKLLRVKSNPSDGNLWRSCHLNSVTLLAIVSTENVSQSLCVARKSSTLVKLIVVRLDCQ